MRRLAFQLPTVLQVTASYAVLFHKGGVTQLTNLDNPNKYSPIYFPADQAFHRIWVLVDLNPNNPEPAPIFRYGSPFFPVCTMSPHSKRPDWLNKLSIQRFYMKPWSILEVVQAYADLTFGGPQHSHSVAAPSSVIRVAQNVNSGICSISLAHLPEPWLYMVPTRTATKSSSGNTSTKYSQRTSLIFSKIQDPLKTPTTSSPYIRGRYVAAALGGNSPHDVCSIWSGRNTFPVGLTS